MKLLDPVCGMTVSKNSEHHLHHVGKDFYFCSGGCLNKFQDNPDKYLIPVAAISSTYPEGVSSLSAETYTCPMHPEVEQQGPGSYPINRKQ